MNHPSRIALIAVALATLPLAASAADLTIELRGIKDPQGFAYAALYRPADVWLKRPHLTTRAAVSMDGVRLTFRDLEPGDYAVSAFHDQDGNGTLSANLIGMPIEPWGMSNDAVGNYGPPSFEQSRFKLPAGGATLTITLRS